MSETARSSSARVWTPDQLAGITTCDRAVLVSAAAGSGKTAVLAERCVHLVTDARPVSGIDQLLVVTFAEEAAAEMKHRVMTALRARAAAGPNPRLHRQLALVDHASISTMHSFCARLIRQHFQRLELDPDFSVLDADDASLMLQESARQLFDSRYGEDRDGSFSRFIDAYGDGSDQDLLKDVVSAQKMLTSVVDPAAWMVMARRRITDAVADLDRSALGRELHAMIALLLNGLRHTARDAIHQLQAAGDFQPYLDHGVELQEVLEQWSKVQKDDGYDQLAAKVSSFNPRDTPRVSSKIPGKDRAMALLNSFKKPMKEGPLRDLLCFTRQQLVDGLSDTLPHLDVFLGLVKQLDERYTAAKRAAGGVDFADLERLALRLLCDGFDDGVPRPSDIARQCHDRFHHVLVDEYQDINPVQDAILSLVSTDCLSGPMGNPSNLFCVGDVKQSIYRFRLAAPARFLERRQVMLEHRDAVEACYGCNIDLQANFRSRAPLLNAINAVFSRLMRADAVEIEYDASQQLLPGREHLEDPSIPHFRGAPVELHLLPDSRSIRAADTDDDAADDLTRTQVEAELLAQRIQEIMGLRDTPRMSVVNAAGDGFRPIEYADIVILLRSMLHKPRQIAQVFARYNIPVHSDGGDGFFNSREVRDLLALLSVLDNARQDIPLAAVLRSPFANLPDVESALARVRAACRDGDFHHAVTHCAEALDDELAARLRDCFADLSRWRHWVRNRPLAEALRAILDQSGYMTYCAGLPDGPQRVANIRQFQDYAERFGAFRRQGLYRFLRFMNDLRGREKDAALPSVAAAHDAIRIMTIHRSKGLEFPVVLLPDLGKKISMQDIQGSILVDRAGYVGMKVFDPDRLVRYPSLAHRIVADSVRRQVLSEELRLLYVAMTRAKEHLILAGTCGSSAMEKWTERWSGHAGSFPAETLLAAVGPLNWIGPAAVAIDDANVIQVTTYTPDDVAQWSAPQRTRPSFTPWQNDRAALKPLDPSPAPDPAADAVIERLKQQYPFDAFTTLPASVSVTQLTHAQDPAQATVPVPGDPVQDGIDTRDGGPELTLPDFMLEEQTPTGTDRGTATHLVFQYLDFTRPCIDEDLSQQIADMHQRHQLTDVQVDLVDHGAVEWFVAGPLGQLIRSAKAVWREIPFDLSLDPQRLGGPPVRDPLDHIMLRGRVDLLVSDGKRLHVIDYKTDRITARAVPAKSRTYRQQLNSYREALGRILPDQPVQLHLVYLTPRVIDTW